MEIYNIICAMTMFKKIMLYIYDACIDYIMCTIFQYITFKNSYSSVIRLFFCLS